MSKYSNFVSIETTAATTQASQPFNVSYIDTIINDEPTGGNNIIFNFTGGDTNAPGSFTLKPGQFITGYDIQASVLYFRASAGTPAFRAWGLR